MKVILLTDVKNVGKKGQVVEVADGYGRNFLCKNNMAEIASEKNLKDLKEQEAKEAINQQELKKKAEEIKIQLEKLVLEFKVSVGKEGKVFGSVSTKQICEELAKKYQINVDKKKFIDTNALNELGTHKVKVELFKGVVANLNVKLIEK